MSMDFVLRQYWYNTHLYRYGQLSPALKFYNAIGWTTGDKEKYRKKSIFYLIKNKTNYNTKAKNS